MKPAPIPVKKPKTLTEGMKPAVHISYQVTIAANLMAFGGSPANCKQFGINIREWRVMGLLGPMGPLTASQIVSELHQDKANVSRAIAELEQKGLIVRLPNNAHKRSPYIWLSEKGMALYQKILPTFTKQSEQFASSLTAAEQKTLCQLLDKLKENTEKIRSTEGLE